MASPVKKELKLLYQYACNCSFIIETGSGFSTKMFSRIGKGGAKVHSIDIDLPKDRFPFVEYHQGWSVDYSDIIKLGDPRFAKSKYECIDGRVAMEGEQWMTGPRDLIRKIILESDGEVDFFFCDTGEYCGLAEWNIVADEIRVGGYFASHDRYYPKSTKSFEIVCDVLRAPNWTIKELTTDSKQGLLIAQKV